MPHLIAAGASVLRCREDEHGRPAQPPASEVRPDPERRTERHARQPTPQRIPLTRLQTGTVLCVVGLLHATYKMMRGVANGIGSPGGASTAQVSSLATSVASLIVLVPSWGCSARRSPTRWLTP
jgi:hypothetical protein